MNKEHEDQISDDAEQQPSLGYAKCEAVSVFGRRCTRELGHYGWHVRGLMSWSPTPEQKEKE